MTSLIDKAEKFVLELFKEKLPNTYLYHNERHTQRVVKSTKELIDSSEIHVKQEEPLLIAAWLHDIGYTLTYDGHEDESKKMAEEFLKENAADEELIREVLRLIDATKPSHEPVDLSEKIIRDADTSHLSKDYFEEVSELLRQELELQKIRNFSVREWVQQNIQLFTKNHRFYTAYALENWEDEKHENLLSLLNTERKSKKKLEKEETKARLKARFKDESPDRGIQTLFRVTMRNHLKLSDIADAKANILLSVNAIVISLLIANLIPDLTAPTKDYQLMIPTLILIIFSVASIIGAIMSTRPDVTSGEFTREQVKNREVNVLFFGNFHRMPYDQFEWAMNEIIDDQDFIYNSLTKDLYMLGVVLNRKYRLLRITYNIFMTGIVLSVLAFILTYYLL
ncbi:Pycsar system effector family protein [Salinimicrobium sp. GXAS 041]|uniref:Pycsar system effector family protein n=1 Tax=Salinimicrobium sp. GXAS 041 TaxID=3400806 RepID=UPI003C7843CD